jgi:hypothetical protein
MLSLRKVTLAGWYLVQSMDNGLITLLFLRNCLKITESFTFLERVGRLRLTDTLTGSTLLTFRVSIKIESRIDVELAYFSN